ncbi:hypothetical protein SAMN05444414_1121 [Roseovarius marisflavi]|uniref:Uncharacterized protein n=1 Tax=Roseovarius marisflavi TaxID=1054996 RepID=A0A1M7A2A8_9RHOB|nr:hypothetical protein SAMN05444414_1121 [Roseovarius marisflavi]
MLSAAKVRNPPTLHVFDMLCQDDPKVKNGRRFQRVDATL